MAPSPSLPVSCSPGIPGWLCCPGGQASPVWQVPEDGMSSLLWLLQRAQAHPQLALLQRGKLGFEQGTAGLGLSQHRERAGQEARRGEQIFDGVFQLLFPLFFYFAV